MFKIRAKDKGGERVDREHLGHLGRRHLMQLEQPRVGGACVELLAVDVDDAQWEL